ncbi:MAG: hypothetical protein HY080_07840 [Gammaproteobacteria bacterium]|nr:hypothetical protein [Gammaproteobacteria bacterium]
MKLSVVLIGVCFTAFAASVHASCGSASCSLSTPIDSLGITANHGWQADLRYEYINQDDLRAGTHTVGVGAIPQDHNEVYTKNNNVLATLDYSADNRWGVSIQLPYLQREHYHIQNTGGVPIDERWNFSALGDIRVLGRVILDNTMATRGQTGLQLGVKLPTGKINQTNAAGEVAERSLQPGTGTTDLLAGYFDSRDMAWLDSTGRGFLQAQLQSALNDHAAYRPGTQYHFNIGMVFRPHADVSPIVQLNALSKGRDRGDNAEPDASGGEYLWLSPGLNLQLSHSTRTYGYVQLPLYQRVNGMQLTSKWNASVGITWSL